MKKIVSVLLTLSLLLHSTPISASGLFQWDDFITHAQFHMDKYGDGFFIFLSKHYGELKDKHNKLHGEEKQKHKSLPDAGQAFFVTTSCVIQIWDNSIAQYQPEVYQTSIFFYKESFYEYIPQKILQPPRS